eukprot:Protomagalhaensia_wolfi_Nauph_80__1302@NODE_1776_length_1346_cov_7_159908_g1384_i0_p1_GENE_NODE_1776_length_1346_cov_7_159908_g1384_i0NODE_1776_length_1346_cov_7_159908_g1384_i0_p1_ORF_typecomplete_len404_score63_92Factin_cap_A/PF01267_17/1_4e08_NODE_1776_length_1346_cov_7_159908_g1384_i0481259
MSTGRRPNPGTQVPTLTFKASPASTAVSPRKALATTRVSAKTHRTLIKEFQAPRYVLVQSLSEEAKIQAISDWLVNFPPTRFATWFFRLSTGLKSSMELDPIIPQLDSLASGALNYTTAVLPIPRVRNPYPHWGTFCSRPEQISNPAVARILVMEGSRVQPDEVDAEYDQKWNVIFNTQLDLVQVSPTDRSVIELREVDDRVMNSADMKLLQAGMQMGFAGALEDMLREYSVRRYPCPASAVSLAVRRGLQSGQPDAITIDIGVSGEQSEEWNGRFTSEWRVKFESAESAECLIEGGITSDAQSLIYGAFRMKQRKKIPAHRRPATLRDIDGFCKMIITEIEEREDEVQLALQKWLCSWHEGLWRNIWRWDGGVPGSSILRRQGFCSELEAALQLQLPSNSGE